MRVDLKELPLSLTAATFKMFEGRWLTVSDEKSPRVEPFNRALSFHAKRAHLAAVVAGWITKEQCDNLQSFSSDYNEKETAERCLAWVQQQQEEI